MEGRYVDRHEADGRWPGDQSDAGWTDMRQMAGDQSDAGRKDMRQTAGDQSDAGRKDMRQTAGDQVTSQMSGGQTWDRLQVTRWPVRCREDRHETDGRWPGDKSDAGRTDMRQTAGDQVTSQMSGGQTWDRRQVTRWPVRCQDDRHETDGRWPGDKSDVRRTDMRQTAGDQVTSQMSAGQTWGRWQVNSQMSAGKTWGRRQVTRWPVRCREDRHDADGRWPGDKSDARRTYRQRLRMTNN